MLTLTPDELHALTRYRRAGDQLRELHLQGFSRARLGRDGSVILERAHYEAVCQGQRAAELPKVRPPKLRAVRMA